MRTRLVALGAIALLAQVALLRELSVAFYGSELILILALGVWLLAVGVGAVLPGRPQGAGSGFRDPAPGFLFVAVTLPAVLVVTRNLRPLLGAMPGAYPGLGGMLLAVPVVLLPAATPVGLLFRDLARAYADRGGTLAGAYALESAGSLLGGLLATGLLLAGASNLAVLWLAAVTAAFCAGLPAGPVRLRFAGRIWTVLLLLAVPLLGRLDAGLTSLVHPDLLAVRDTPYGRLTLLQRGDQKVVLVNDALVYEDQGTATEEFVHLAALQVTDPDSVLVLGGTVRGMVADLLQHRPSRITGIELDRRGLALERRLLSPEDTAALDDPRVGVVYADPRAWLRGHQDRFDLIVIRMPQPDSGLSNRYYTREFFALCARHLHPGGVLVFSLRAAENYWTPLLTLRNAAIIAALRSVLPEVTVLPGASSTVLASTGPLPDAATLADRFVRRGIHARLMGPAYIRYLYANDRRGEIAGQLAAARVRANTDLQPVCYRYSLALWLSRFHARVSAARWPGWNPGRGTGLVVGAVLLLLMAAAVAARRRGMTLAASGPWVVLGAGWYGLLLESVLVLAYQTTSGVLYRDLGLLLTMFMAGMAAGAWRFAQKCNDRGGTKAAGWILTGSLLPVLLTVMVLRGILAGGLVMTSALLLGAGGITGALFALAAAVQERETAVGIGPLYALDLLGGSLASVLGGLLVMPVFGLEIAALVAGGPMFLMALSHCPTRIVPER